MAEAEQNTWVGKFSRAVSEGWKEKHTFVLREAGFAEHTASCDVQVQHVDDAADANNVITAQWVPRGGPRLRSFVNGSTSELDVRDVDEPETYTVPATRLIRQIPGFEHDSDAINSTVESGIEVFENAFERLSQPGQPFSVPKSEIETRVEGRASSPGSARYNKDLGSRRAGAVADRLMDDLELESTVSSGIGERHASDDEKFRRVDVAASTGGDIEVSQNTAAHEAGHMFGLGDEYVEENAPEDVLPKFPADLPSHHGDVKDTLGEEAANELLVDDGPSIMSQGSEVKPGHYVYFVNALNRLTGKSWSVE
jgi:outer membrane protein OmpA-like peptidoglycan-associated protein